MIRRVVCRLVAVFDPASLAEIEKLRNELADLEAEHHVVRARRRADLKERAEKLKLFEIPEHPRYRRR